MNEIAMLPTLIVHQILDAAIGAVSKNIAFSLITLTTDGQVTLAWSDYLAFCQGPTRNRSAGRRHLSRLKTAGIIDYATNDGRIFIHFYAWPRIEIARQRAETARSSESELDPTVEQYSAPVRQRAETARHHQPSLYIGSLGLGGEGRNRDFQNTAALIALGTEMLSDCELVANREQFATEVPFEELRALTLRWHLDSTAKTPGSLKYRIEHRHANSWRGQITPLTDQEYQQPFVQRYRTAEEIALDTAFEQEQRVAQLLCSTPASVDVDTGESEPTSMTGGAACEADPEAVNIWQSLLAELQMQLSPNIYTTWVQQMHLIARTPSNSGDEWRIGLPAGFALDWVKNRLAPKITRALSARVQKAVDLHFEVLTSTRSFCKPNG